MSFAGQMTIFDYLTPNREIEGVLKTGSQLSGGKMRIYALYLLEKKKAARARFLADEYGTGGRSFCYDDRRGYAGWSKKGIEVLFYDVDNRQAYTWQQADEIIMELIDRGMYMTEEDMAAFEKATENGIIYPEAGHEYPPKRHGKSRWERPDKVCRTCENWKKATDGTWNCFVDTIVRSTNPDGSCEYWEPAEEE